MEDFLAITSSVNLGIKRILDCVHSNEQRRSFKLVIIVCSIMTNKLQQITTLTLATILITGTLSLMPIAYSTGSNNGNNHWDHDDDDDDNHDSQKIKICHIPPGNPNNAHTITISKSAWDAHKAHGDYKGKCNNDNDNREDCKCRKPSTLTVKYTGPPGAVDIEIYKKIEDVGSPQKKLLTVTGITDTNTVLISSTTFGKESLETNTIYRVMQGTTQLAVVTINTSCSQPLFIGKQYTNNQVTLTVLSGEDSKGKQSIFLEHDPICEGAKLTVTKIVDDPPLNSGKFILKISKDGSSVYQSAELGNGESTGPQALMPGTYTVDESSGAGTNLDDYIRTIGGDCNPDGSIELEKGDKAECIVTNTKIKPATITLKKVITQDNTNSDMEIPEAEIKDHFKFYITNIQLGSVPILIDENNEEIPPGTYTLKEVIDEEYEDVFDFVLITGDDDCPTMVEDMEEFTLDSGEHLTCVVYNEDDKDTPSSDGGGIIFRNHSLKIQMDAKTSNDSCDKYPNADDKNACIEIIDPSDDTIGIVDSALTSDTTIVLFSVIEADQLGTTFEAETPTCVISAIVRHDNTVSAYLKDETDMDSTPENPSENNVVVLSCIGMDPSLTYNVNYVMIDPLL